MKNLLAIIILTTLNSCDHFKTQPKCDDAEVKSTVIEMVDENKTNYSMGAAGAMLLLVGKDNVSVENIITNEKDEELQKCDCEGSLAAKGSGISVSYSAQINSEGETVVKINNLGENVVKVE